MPKTKKTINPFYILLLLAGAAFAITAMAYGVMTVRTLQASRTAGYGPIQTDVTSSLGEPSSFDGLMDRYGANLMICELVLLTIGTIGAIGYDQHLDRKQVANNVHKPKSKETL